MTWKEKIETGMILIMEGCRENSSWPSCRTCPFDEYCTVIFQSEQTNKSTPDCWEEEGEVV